MKNYCMQDTFACARTRPKASDQVRDDRVPCIQEELLSWWELLIVLIPQTEPGTKHFVDFNLLYAMN